MVPYHERQNYLLEADIGCSLHFETLETYFAFRTRILDYIWAGLPMIVTRGDATSEIVKDYELGIVVDYGGYEGLFLLAVRDRATGKYSPWPEVLERARWLGFPTPRTFHRFDTVEGIADAARHLDGNAEGWVVEFSDGQRFKFKGDRYV